MNKIIFVGEAPFNEVEEKCLQRAGQVAGLDFALIGRTSIAKRRPSGNKFREAFYETVEEPIYTKTGKLSKVTKKVVRKTDELSQWEDALCNELRTRNPNLIVACGNEVLETITGITGIMDYRGSILPDKWGDSHKVLAIESPEFIIRGNPERFWILARDLQKAKREMEFREIRREPYISYIKPELQLVKNELEYIRINPTMKFSLDVETRGGTLACFALGYFTPKGVGSICVPIQTASGPYWTVEEELEIWRVLRETARNNPNLCNQNIEYDISYLLRYGVEPGGVYMDTMLAHSILYPELPKDLGFLGSWYLDDVVWWKNDHREWSGRTSDEALWSYNCKDACFTLRIMEKIDEELKRREMWEMYHGCG